MNNVEVFAKHVSAVDMGFGETFGMDLFPYKLEIPRLEFNELFQTKHDDLVADLKEDDKMMGEFNPPYPNAKSYPELADLPALNSEQLTYYIDFLREEIWWEYFWGKGTIPKYYIQTWDKVEFRNDMFVIQGLAWVIKNP